VLTSVLDTSPGAGKMYEGLGFEYLETYEEARLFLPE